MTLAVTNAILAIASRILKIWTRELAMTVGRSNQLSYEATNAEVSHLWVQKLP